MIVSLSEQLQAAKKGKYAVGLFNVVSLEMMKSVFRAAEVSNSPLIIGCADVMTKYILLEELSALAIPMLKRTEIPVTLHFDHAHIPTLILRAMRLGFNSIMYDCSDLSFEENCEKVRVRIHGELARIEVEPSEFDKLINAADDLNSYLKSLGFKYVTMDLGGYRMGSMNDTL